MTALVESQAGGRPPAIPARLDGVLSVALNRLEPPFGASPLVGLPGRDPYRLRHEHALTPAQREALQAYSDALDRALWPAGHVIATEEYQHLCNMRAPAATAEEIKREAFRFVEDNQDLPAFALREACDAFRLGRIGDGEWMPKVGQVRREAERLKAPFLKHRRQVRAVLTATVGKPEDVSRKAAVVAALRDLAAEMRADLGPPKRGGMTDAQLREARALSEAIRTGTPDPRPMPKLSPEHRRALGLPPREIEPSTGRFGDEHAA